MKLLQTNYDKLQAAYCTHPARRSSQLSLMQRSRKTRFWIQIRQRYETDVLTVRQQAKTLQCDLDKEIKSHADTDLEGWRVINKLRVQ